MINKKDFIKCFIEDYFKQNKMKDVTEISLNKLNELPKLIGDYIINELSESLSTLTVSDLYDAQAKTVTAVKAVDNSYKSVEPASYKLRGRKPNADPKKYIFSAEYPNGANPDTVYVVSYRKDGKLHKSLYTVLVKDENLDLQKQRNAIKVAYAKKVNTNYLNVTLRTFNGWNRQLNKNKEAKYFDKYIPKYNNK